MHISDLPTGDSPEALRFEHFPTRQQAFVWRNWGLVEVEKLAEVLGTTRENVAELAEGMGLDPAQKVTADWLTKGYVTIIRQNWHLLPYEQLLKLLGWSIEKLNYVLREEDFLYVKLGVLKPECEVLKYRQLSENENLQTFLLKQCVQKHFSQTEIEYIQKPFTFYSHFASDFKLHYNKFDTRKFPSNIIYAYAASYGDALLSQSEELYPDILLEQLAINGITGIWLQAVLYTLMPWRCAPELSEGYQQRLKNLNTLVQRAAKYGIGVYLYLNEPRPMQKSFFERNPDWPEGAAYLDGFQISLCTSNPQTLQFVYDATKFVFENVPLLAGIITITMSENFVHCHSRNEGHKCPRCSKRRPEDVVVELNSTISRAVHDAAPQARVIVWTWAWNDEWSLHAIDMLPDDVEIMCVSEWGLPTNVGGVTGSVKDYSISQVGPSDTAKKLWRKAKSRGLKVHAKVQINTTWECSAMPYIPVPSLVEEHLNNLHCDGIDGILASWTLGGYPGGNLPLLCCSASQLAECYGNAAKKKIMQAWDKFATAFREFPFSMDVVYYASHNMGPANLLFMEPTKYKATMVGLPYDDIETWRSIYPAEIFEHQWKKLSEQWKDGLDLLLQAGSEVSLENLAPFEEMKRISQACYCHFRSMYLQIAFVRLRESQGNKKMLMEFLDEEISLAKILERLVREDCRIGFEATNQYAYTPNDLREKVLNCENLKQRIF